MLEYCRYAPHLRMQRLALDARPQARTEIAELHDRHLEVALAAPAAEGKADAWLIRRPTDKLDLPGGRVMIRRGSHGRTKIIEIYGQAAFPLARVKEQAHS